MATNLMFFVSYLRYIVITDTGTSRKRVEIVFPDDEDYDADELIDEDVLGIIENATSRLDLAILAKERGYCTRNTHKLIAHIEQCIPTI